MKYIRTIWLLATIAVMLLLFLVAAIAEFVGFRKTAGRMFKWIEQL